MQTAKSTNYGTFVNLIELDNGDLEINANPSLDLSPEAFSEEGVVPELLSDVPGIEVNPSPFESIPAIVIVSPLGQVWSSSKKQFASLAHGSTTLRFRGNLKHGSSKKALDALFQELNDEEQAITDPRTDKEYDHPFGSKGTEPENTKYGSFFSNPVQKCVEILTRIVESFPGTAGGCAEMSPNELKEATRAVVEARNSLKMASKVGGSNHLLEQVCTLLDQLAKEGDTVDIRECARMTAGDLRYFATPEWLRKEASGELYHVTFTKNVPKIRKRGLLPMQTTNWVRRGDKERYGKGEVFAFESKTDAMRWAAKMDWDFKQETGSGEISIITLQRGDTSWEVDEADPLGQAASKGKWLKSPSAVPASQIISAEPFTKEMVQALVRTGSVEMKPTPRSLPPRHDLRRHIDPDLVEEPDKEKVSYMSTTNPVEDEIYCPVCGSGDIDDDEDNYLTVSCNQCGHEFSY